MGEWSVLGLESECFVRFDDDDDNDDGGLDRRDLSVQAVTYLQRERELGWRYIPRMDGAESGKVRILIDVWARERYDR